MVSVRFVPHYLQKLGLLNIRKEDQVAPWKRNLHKMFVIVQYTVIITGLLSHLLSTVTRSVRFSAELVQAIFEDAFSFLGLYLVNFIRLNHGELVSLIEFMDKFFSKADANIIGRCKYQSKMLLIAVFAALNCSVLGAFLESVLPLSENDLQIRRLVYQTKHPERRHLFNVHFPFIDESESWAFEIVLAHQVYGCILMNCLYSLTLCILPLILLTVQGQYEMLANYVAKIGVEHRDNIGNEIMYTNIVTDEFYAVTTYEKARKFIFDKKVFVRRQEVYQQFHLKQIVQFHHKLLIFHEKVCFANLINLKAFNSIKCSIKYQREMYLQYAVHRKHFVSVCPSFSLRMQNTVLTFS
ncbi:hypothetical protein WDU94_012517 [Cyamophila willieti]